MTVRSAALAAIVAGMAACAGAAPRGAPAGAAPGDREAFLASLRLRFPAEGFIVGYGEGATAERAELRAAADVVAQIRSTIRGSVGVVETGTFRDGRGTVDTRVVDEVLQEVESDAGALIRPQRELTREGGGAFQAVAVARREELDARAVAQARPALERLGLLLDRALRAATWLDAAAAACEADRLGQRVDKASLERWAVTRRSLWTPELADRRRAVEERRQRAKAALKVVVARAAEPLEGDPAQAIVRDLRAAGWLAEAADRPSCAGEALVVASDVASTCRNSATGLVFCRSALTFEGRDCRTSAAVFSVSSPPAEASDSREQERARRAALRRLDLAAAARSASERLRAVLGDACEAP